MSQIKVELQEFMGSDRSIAEAAWTSSLTYQGKGKRTSEDVSRVVQMLADNGHSTPFESVVLRFWMKLPIQTDRQHMTHRIASHNGMSGRYRTMPDEFLDMPSDVKLILNKLSWNGQSGRSDQYEDLCQAANDWYNTTVKDLKTGEQAGYITNAELKRAREFIRGVLPQNNMTERVTIFNLRSFANYMKLRNSTEAQSEIHQLAELMLEEVKRKGIAPVAVEWLEKNGWRI